MIKYDLIIVGASFAGLSCAKAAAERGLRVAVLERKKDLTRGIHTTGILVQEAMDVIRVPRQFINKINRVRIYSPSLNYIDLSSADYSFYATDTPKLIIYLAKEATDVGVEIYLDNPFEFATRSGQGYIVNNSFYCSFLVGADGAKSKVATHFNLGLNRKFLLGNEIEYLGVELDAIDRFDCFIDKEVAPGYIAWVVPGVGITQVGVAASTPQRANLKNFCDKISKIINIKGHKILNRRGGLIPIGGVVKPFHRDNVILTGDAAGIVSPLTGGGIHTAAYFGVRLANLIADYMSNICEHPANYLQHEYPEFYIKQFLRKIYAHVPNALFDLIFKIPKIEMIANQFFFLRKKLKLKKANP